jgi:small subunit ribosomal protein S6
MRNYEVGVIVHPETNQEVLNEMIEKIKGWIVEAGGSVDKVDLWGKRRMAYAIRRQHDGLYAFLNTQMPTTVAAILERNLRLTESIMRFAIVRTDG